MLCNVIKLPSNFALTIGWMCLWWTVLRVLFLFCVNSWISVLDSAVSVIAPFMEYIYTTFISQRADEGFHSTITKVKTLISFCMFFLCVDAIFQILLIYAANKKSFMWMLPWILYSFMTLIILTVLPLDYYTRPLPNQTSNDDRGIVYAIEQMSSYFIYLAIQLILLIAVFENFQKLRVNRSYYYLKQAISTEKEMIFTMLDLYEQSILNRFTSQVSKKANGPCIVIKKKFVEPSEKPKNIEMIERQ